VPAPPDDEWEGWDYLVDRPPIASDLPGGVQQPLISPRKRRELEGERAAGSPAEQHEQHEPEHERTEQSGEQAGEHAEHEQQPPVPSTADLEESDMLATTLARPPVSPAARMLLDRSRAGLLQALAARSPGERFVTAHLAALRAAAAVLAVRSRPGGRGGPRSVWEVLPRVAPELGEWASFFAATASRRAAIEAGRSDVVSAREADDLLRDAEAFHHLVESSLGLPYQQVLPGTLPSCE
jgi:hypothetical protein